jgi:hypothetical protein
MSYPEYPPEWDEPEDDEELDDEIEEDIDEDELYVEELIRQSEDDYETMLQKRGE